MSNTFSFIQPAIQSISQSVTRAVEGTDDEAGVDYSSNILFRSADQHNIANGGVSWANPKSWADKIGNIGRFVAVSALSGANGFYNTGIAVGRFFDPGLQERDTARWITSLDSNLADYYRLNQESADLTGFILGSLIPGIGSIKIFNAGQLALRTAIKEGAVGAGMGRSLGLLLPKTDDYMKAAIKEITASTTTLNLINANTTRAIGAGLWQNTMEAAAFETMVYATMFRSPILQEQDGWDIAKNIAVGGIFGGAVAGVFGAAKLRGTLKKAIDEEEVLRRPFQERPQFSTATNSDSRIIQLAFDTEAAAQPVQLRRADGTLVDNEFSSMQRLYQQKITSNLLDIRTEFNSMAGNDLILGNTFANFMSPVIKDGLPTPGFAQTTYSSISGAKQLLRATEVSTLEEAMAKALAKGEVPETVVAARYVKLFGEDAGQTFTERPTVLYFGDRLKSPEAIKKYIKTEYEFKGDFTVGLNRWSTLGLKGQKAHVEAEARYIWASKASGMLKEIPDGATVDAFDLPVLQRAYEDGQWNISVISGEGPSLSIRKITSKEDLYDQIKQSKEETALHFGNSFLTKRGKEKKEGLIPKEDFKEQIAKIADVRLNYLDGNPSGVEIDDLFATKAAQRKYLNQLRERGLPLDTPEGATPIEFMPRHGKVVYEVVEDVSAANPHILDGLAHYTAMEKIYVEDAQRVAAKVLGSLGQQLPKIPKDKLVTATRNDPSAGLFSNDSSNLGTVSSAMSFVGSLVRQMKQDLRKQSSDALESSLVKLAAKPEAAFEFESLNQKITRTGKQFYLKQAEDGTAVLVDKKLVGKDGEVNWELAEDGVNAFNIVHDETVAAWAAHLQQTGKRTGDFRDIHAAQGKIDNKDQNVIRPIRPDLKQYPHFAFVKDPRVTGQGHTTMIHAASEKELAALVERVPPEYKVIYKRDTEEYFQARGEYDYQRTLNENYLDGELANKGVFSNFFPKSDPAKIVDDILQQHYRESDTIVYEAVRLHYEPEFGLLEDLGKQYSRVETSKFASRADMIEASSKNPYFNQIKTALDISKINEHPLIYNANKLLDGAFSRAVASIRDTWNQTNNLKDLDKINTLLDQWGMKPAYYDAALQAMANHTAPRGELTRFVRGANAILSRFTLGLDPLNALNNAIGSNVLRGTELAHITRAIREGNTALAADLAQLSRIALPGVDAEVLAPTKLIARAIKNFWEDAPGPAIYRNEQGFLINKLDANGKQIMERSGPIMQKYRDMQLVKDRAEQLKLLVEDFTLKGTETVSELNRKLDTGFRRAKEMTSEKLDKLEKFTGNTLAEEFNRFVSANVMDQITQVAIKHGIMDDATARTYINTFVNRVEGNIVASQRPLVFQGPIGQAISLFQSYQFNMIQQLLRYSAEGKAKDLAMLAGLQSTLYGAQSLPGFQAINVHLIGQLSGNTEHRDLYDATYGAVGRTAGDFLLYGLPSRMILGWGEGNGINIYSRGDINPRHLTILPTSLQETPIVAGWGKFFGNIYETSKKIAGGANVWETFLQGVEHNGISRPLAGMAQTLQAFGPTGQAYSTSNKGTILYQNDLMSLATLTRMAGGRPLDEAIVNDAMFRVKSYEAARRSDMASLSERVKSTLIQGNDPSPEQIESFAARYAELGGKQEGFNKWMMEMYKSANTSQAQKLQESLSNPYTYKVQLLMGGEE